MRRDFAAGAGDEDAVGVGQLVEGFGGAAEDGVHVRDAEPFGVLLDQAVVFGVHFDRVDRAVVRHLGGFDADRAAAGADVPDDARRGDIHLGECDRADFGGREQAVLGFRLQERFVGVAEEAAADGFARAVRRVGVADEDHHVERVEPLAGDFLERAAGDAFVARAQVFANVRGEVVDAAIEQRRGHGRPGRSGRW